MNTRRRRLAVAIVATLIVVAIALTIGRPARFNFRIEAESGDSATYVVRGTAINARAKLWIRTRSQLDPYLKVYSRASKEPLFGIYERDGDEVRFRPSVPPPPGVGIYATFTEGGQTKAEYEPQPSPSAIVPQVVGIYPTASVLPENLIKFYIEFSVPMTSGDFFGHVELFNETIGTPVAGAFREVELWSPDGKRFTLWLHPGRQKTGVNLNQDEGPVLRNGGKYVLKISDRLTSTTGTRLKTPATKSFAVGPHDSTMPNMERWTITTPPHGTATQLKIAFDEPMDWAMQSTALSVLDEKGKVVPGIAELANGETVWSFTPAHPWAQGRYTLQVNPDFEDLAGNSLARLFESSVVAPDGPSSAAITVRGFSIGR